MGHCKKIKILQGEDLLYIRECAICTAALLLSAFLFAEGVSEGENNNNAAPARC
jgi:hypothetical protein